MNWRVIKVVIGREYFTKVKKKSFILVTFLTPLLFAAMCVLPSVIMFAAKEEAKKVAVVDKSGIVLPSLVSGADAVYSDYSSFEADSVKANLGKLDMDALLYISPLDSTLSVKAVATSPKPLGVELLSKIEKSVNKAVEAYRVDSYHIDGLEQIISDVKSDVTVLTYTLGEDGKETISASEVYMIVSMVLGMIIYMFIAMFCSMIMSSIIEEKSSRVVEVLVSSVKATELLFGKLIGVAFVAFTQFFLWIILTFVIVSVAGIFLGFDTVAQSSAAMGDASMMGLGDMSVEDPNGLTMIFSTLGNLNFGGLLLGFFVYFIFGYLIYASLFAAIGSAVENEADAAQLQIPVTVPLMIAFFIAFYAFKAPDSSVVFWGSIVPFTSPIVMLTRLPFGVPAWQIALSIVLLIGTFIFCAWLSAKIYKVGILMFGKKTTFKDLWNWLRQK